MRAAGLSRNGKQYSWTGARVFSLGRIGLSASTNDLPAGARRTVAGAYGTFPARPLVVLAEADVIHDADGTNPERHGGAGHVEVDAQVHAGLTVRLFGGPRQTQWGVGVDWTALPGLQLRVLYRDRGGPASVPGGRDDQAWLEAHVFF